MIKGLIKSYSQMGAEPLIWAVALLFLGISDPYQLSDFTLCPLSNVGIHNCPGCGLGRSVSYALHGEFSQSIHTHLLGMPAIIILAFRVCTLLFTTFRISHSQSVHHKPKEPIWPA